MAEASTGSLQPLSDTPLPRFIGFSPRLARRSRGGTSPTSSPPSAPSAPPLPTRSPALPNFGTTPDFDDHSHHSPSLVSSEMSSTNTNGRAAQQRLRCSRRETTLFNLSPLLSLPCRLQPPPPLAPQSPLAPRRPTLHQCTPRYFATFRVVRSFGVVFQGSRVSSPGPHLPDVDLVLNAEGRVEAGPRHPKDASSLGEASETGLAANISRHLVAKGVQPHPITINTRPTLAPSPRVWLPDVDVDPTPELVCFCFGWMITGPIPSPPLKQGGTGSTHSQHTFRGRVAFGRHSKPRSACAVSPPRWQRVTSRVR